MIRPTLRICVFAAAIAASLTHSHHSQADEKKPFFSRLNPRTWFQKNGDKDLKRVEQDADRASEQRSGTEMTSTRPHLKDDPFGISPAETGSTLPSISPKVAARPPINRDPVPVARPSVNQPVARTPLAPDSRSGSVRVTDIDAETEVEGDSAPIASQKPKTSKTRRVGNDFVDNFDKDYAKIVATTRRDNLPDSDDEPQTQAKPSSFAKTPATPSAAARPATKTVARTAAPARDSDLPSLPDLPDSESAIEGSREVARTTSNDRRQASIDALARAARMENSLPNDSDDSFSASGLKADLERPVASRQRAQQPTARHYEADTDDVETRSISKSQADRKTAARTEQRPLPRTEILNAQRGTSSGLTLLAPDTQNSLIVSNELVPERRHYTGSQSYRANAGAASSTSSSTTTTTTTDSADQLPVVQSGGAGIRSSRGQVSYAASNEPVAKVSSNKASVRSDPTNSTFRQMSYDDSEAESRLPLLSIGAGSAPSGADNGPLLLLPDVSNAGHEAVVGREKVVAQESAPAFEWPDKLAQPEPKKAPFGTLFTILGLMAVGCGVGLRLRKKGQLATAGQTPARALDEIVG